MESDGDVSKDLSTDLDSTPSLDPLPLLDQHGSYSLHSMIKRSGDLAQGPLPISDVKKVQIFFFSFIAQRD